VGFPLPAAPSLRSLGLLITIGDEEPEHRPGSLYLDMLKAELAGRSSSAWARDPG
jgi:hypothetical protein